MTLKHTGDKLIFLITISTILLFLWVKQGTSTNSLLFLSQLFSLTGAVLFSLSFLISSRTRFVEKLFDGLSDAYKTHHFIGALGFALLLNHPFFLILKAFFNEGPIKLYFLPTGLPSYSYGIISLYSLITLIVITLFINFKYNTWKLTHTFMGLALFFALLHTLNIPSDISRNLVLGLWIKSILVLGCIAYVYKLLFYRKLSGSYIYKIIDLDTIGKVINITVKPKKESMPFSPGQYAFIRVLDNKNVSKEEHPFSIVDGTANGDLLFSIKKSGDYTDGLENLKTGDKLEIIGPFGLIHTKLKTNLECVFIAGGIGITPFVKTIEESLKLDKKTYLFYSVREQSEALYDNIFKGLSDKSNKMYYNLWISSIQGKLSVSTIQSQVGDLTNKFFFICGPKSMMVDLDKQLREKGVKSKNIYMEDFDLR